MIPRLGRGKGGAQTVNLFDVNTSAGEKSLSSP